MHIFLVRIWRKRGVLAVHCHTPSPRFQAVLSRAESLSSTVSQSHSFQKDLIIAPAHSPLPPHFLAPVYHYAD